VPPLPVNAKLAVDSLDVAGSTLAMITLAAAKPAYFTVGNFSVQVCFSIYSEVAKLRVFRGAIQSDVDLFPRPLGEG